MIVTGLLPNFHSEDKIISYNLKISMGIPHMLDVLLRGILGECVLLTFLCVAGIPRNVVDDRLYQNHKKWLLD